MLNRPTRMPDGRPAHRSSVLTSLIALVALAAFIVPSCVSGPQRASSAVLRTEPDIRVRILRGQDSVELGGAGLLAVRREGASARWRTFPGPLKIAARAGGFDVVDGAGTPTRFSGRGALAVEAGGRGGLSVNGVAHPGGVRLHATPEGMDVVEVVPVEVYLPGVLARELYATWSPATFEAQAIAARSYALHERARRRAGGSHFDVEAGEQDQAYAGATDNARALDAVRRTLGAVLTFQGEILRSYYSSTCGGKAGSARDTWPTGPGFEFNLALPIQGRQRTCACGFSPRFNWQVVRSRDELARRFAAYGRASGLPIKDIRSLASIGVERRNAAGRAAEYRVADNAGRWWRLSAEQLRLACNSEAPGLPKATGDSRVLSGELEFAFAGDRVGIAGSGFGHGVGMCQFGAEGLARRQRTAPEILRHFYPGALIERAY